jgi:hypothetical protein
MPTTIPASAVLLKWNLAGALPGECNFNFRVQLPVLAAAENFTFDYA